MNKIDKIQKSVEGSLVVEGAKPSDKGKSINRDFLKGKISSKEAINKIIKYHRGKANGQSKT